MWQLTLNIARLPLVCWSQDFPGSRRCLWVCRFSHILQKARTPVKALDVQMLIFDHVIKGNATFCIYSAFEPHIRPRLKLKTGRTVSLIVADDIVCTAITWHLPIYNNGDRDADYAELYLDLINDRFQHCGK